MTGSLVAHFVTLLGMTGLVALPFTLIPNVKPSS